MDKKREIEGERKEKKSSGRLDERRLQTELDAIARKEGKLEKEAKEDVARREKLSDLRAKGVKPPEVADPATKKRLEEFEKRTNPEGYRRKRGGADSLTEKKLQETGDRKKKRKKEDFVKR